MRKKKRKEAKVMDGIWYLKPFFFLSERYVKSHSQPQQHYYREREKNKTKMHSIQFFDDICHKKKKERFLNHMFMSISIGVK